MKTETEKKTPVGVERAKCGGRQLNKNGEEVRLYNEPRIVTFENAFSWDHTDDSQETYELNVERAIRSVAFLLDYLGQEINEISAWATLGLADCLHFCADQSAFAQRKRKIEEQFKVDIRDGGGELDMSDHGPTQRKGGRK